MEKRILIVQKGEIEISALTRRIEDLGHQVQVAQSLSEAKDFFDDSPPDLLIISAILSGGSIPDFCKYVRRNTARSKLPIIITSPIFSGTMQLEAKTKWGADDFVVLPAPINILIKTIQYHLGERSDRPKTELTLKYAMKMKNDKAPKKKKSKKTIPKEGDLSLVEIGRLLLVLGSAKRTGGVTIERENETIVLAGHNGKLVRIDSPYIPDLTLGSILVKLKMVTEQDLAPFAKRLEHNEQKLGRMLLDAGALKKDQITKALSRQFIEKAVSVLEFKSGIYRFQKAPVEIAGDFPAETPVARVILEKHRKYFTSGDFEKIYEKKMKKYPKLIEGGSFSLRDLDLPGDLKKIVLNFNGKKNLTEIVKYSGVEQDRIFSLIHTLYELKLISIH